MADLMLENFVLGMRRDGALTQEVERDENAGRNPYILHSLKTMENYDIDYIDGSISPRNGYENYNTYEPLAGPITQIFYHTNLRRDREDIFAVTNERWYRVIRSSAHEMIIDEDVTIDNGYKKPIIVWGDRIFFATDSGWYWTDEDRVYEGTKYYNAGLPKPSSPLIIEEQDAFGSLNTAGEIEIILNETTHRKTAYKAIVTTQVVTDVVNMRLVRTAVRPIGNLRVSIYTDSGDDPSTTLADPYSRSDWLSTNFVPVTAGFVQFSLGKNIKFDPGTYWIVLEGDDSYYDHYSVLSYVSILKRTVANPTNFNIKVYDYASSSWGTYANSVGIFYLGSLISARIYDYVYTYYNSTYAIESRPSDYIRFDPSADYKVAYITHAQISEDIVEDQVDKIKIYRRLLDAGLDIDATEEEITDEYNLVAEIDYGDGWHDSVSETGLGAILGSQDHYMITEGDDTPENRRSAIIPACACIWKGRVWVAPANSNVLYFSKKIEVDCASGLVGDPIPDYFSLDNKLELEEESAMLAVRPLANDQLAIYFRNGPIYVLWGMDEILNPPSEYSYRPMVYNIGLISSWGICDFRNRHIYISRQGLYAFNGSQSEYLSEHIQSILNGISDENLATTVLVSRGEEIWMLLDEDDDGNKETIYILNMQKSTPSWRRYNYGVSMSDLLVKQLSARSSDIFGSDTDNYNIMELDVGNTDNGKSIESYIETHVNRVSNAFIHSINVNAHYPEGKVPASYDFLITDHVGQGWRYQLNPMSSMDIRGHSSGARIKTYGSFSVRMDQLSVQKTDILGINISYNK